MALQALPFSQVQAMDSEQRTEYFERFAGFFSDSPRKPYAIRVGSRTLTSADTLDLRQQFDKLLEA